MNGMPLECTQTLHVFNIVLLVITSDMRTLGGGGDATITYVGYLKCTIICNILKKCFVCNTPK
jgi:hypothetical protein